MSQTVSQETFKSAMSTMTIANIPDESEVLNSSFQVSFSLLHALPAENFHHCASFLSIKDLKVLSTVDRHCREHVLLLQQNDNYAPVYHIDRILRSYMEVYEEQNKREWVETVLLRVQRIAYNYSDFLRALIRRNSDFNMSETDAERAVISAVDALFDCMVNVTQFSGPIKIDFDSTSTQKTIQDLPTLVLGNFSSAVNGALQARQKALIWHHARVDTQALATVRFPCLKALDLQGRLIEQNFLQSPFAQQLESLTARAIKNSDISKLTNVRLPQLRSLTLLDQKDCNVSDILQLAPNVEHLSIRTSSRSFRGDNPSCLSKLRDSQHLRVLDVYFVRANWRDVGALLRALPNGLQEFYFACELKSSGVDVLLKEERPILPASLRVISIVNWGNLALPFSLADATDAAPRSLEVSFAFNDAHNVRLSEYNLKHCTSLTLYSGESHFELVRDQLASLEHLRHFGYHAMTDISEHCTLQQQKKAERLTRPIIPDEFDNLNHFPHLHLQHWSSQLEKLHLTNVIVCNGPGNSALMKLKSIRKLLLRDAFKMVDNRVCMFSF